MDREVSDSQGGAAPKRRQDIPFSEPPKPETIAGDPAWWSDKPDTGDYDSD